MPRIAPAASLLLAACAGLPSAEPENYRALGQEPGWNLTITSGRIDYVGDYGETRISVARPQPIARQSRRRYEAGRLVVDIVNSRCNDSMSGHGYADQVTVTADGRTVTGCGGTRRIDWDV